MILSIVMATYNGEQFIEEQLDSILPYMSESDELIISDDGSTDNTISIITGYKALDKRIKLLKGPQMGVIKNFENALFASTGDIVLFSDQDDVWLPEKLPKVREVFEKNDGIKVLLHDMYVCSNEQIQRGSVGPTSYMLRRWRHGVLYNVLLSCYFGCCMAMTQSFVRAILPFPNSTIAYDQLLGLVAEKNKESLFLKQPLIKRRLHGNNMSQRQMIFKRITFRIALWHSFRDTIKKKNK